MRKKLGYVKFLGDKTSATIAEGIAFVDAHIAPIGCICPCCNRINKLYPRVLNKTCVRILFGLVRVYQERPRWVHVSDVPWWDVDARAAGTIAKLAYWKLAIEHINSDPDKGRSGYWKPTDRGLAFLHKRLRVPRKAFVYQDVVQSYSKETVNVVEALGVKFSYQELMQPIHITTL